MIFSKEAEIQLKHFCCEQQSLKKNKNSLEFYGENELLSIRACIEEVLAVDVRSSWQTGKARKGASQADKALKVDTTNSDSSTLCTQQIDNLLIYFNVIPESSDGNDAISRGSGCNDTVEVHHIEQILKMKKDGKSVSVSYKVNTDAQAEKLNAVQQNNGQNARPEDGDKEEEKATYSDVLETLSISVGQLDVQDNNNEAVYKEVGEKMKLAYNPEEKKKAPSKLDVDIPTHEQEEDNNSSNNLTPCKRPLSNNSTPVSSPSRFKNNTSAALTTVVEQRLNDTSLRFESGIPTAANEHKSELPQVQGHNNSINWKKELKRMRKIGSDEAFAVEGSKRKEYSKKQSFEFDQTRIEKSSEIKEYYHDLKKYWNKASQVSCSLRTLQPILFLKQSIDIDPSVF